MENQEIFRVMFEEATLGIIVVDGSGEIKNTNRFLDKLFGYKKEELVGQKVEMLLPESFRKIHSQHRQSYHKNPVPRSMGANLNLYGLRKDGSRFPLEISLTYTTNTNEKMVIAYLNDISYKKNALKELKVKNKAISSGAMPIAFSDLEGNITDVNDAFVKMWGYNNREELIGINNEKLSSTKEEISVINNAIREKGVWTGEATANKKDGSTLDIYVSSSLVADENGIPFQMLASFIDISQLKKAEKKIIESETNAQILFDYSPVLIWEEDFSQVKSYFDELKESGITDFKTHFSNNSELVRKLAGLVTVTQVNKTSLAFYGVTSKEELNTNIDKWFTDDSLNVFKEELISLAEGQSNFEGEIPIITPSGERKDVFFKLSVPPQYMGTLEKVIVSFVDITAAKKTENTNKDISRIVEESLNEIYIADVDTLQFIQVNKGARQKLGYSVEEITQLTPLDINPNIDKVSFPKLIAPLLSGELEKLQFESSHQQKDKHTYPVEVHLEYSTFGGRNVLVASALDITERKKAEKELKQILTRFETLTELAPIGIFLTDKDGNCQFVNQKWQTMTGISMREALGSGWINSIFPEDKENFREASEKAFGQGLSCNLDYRVLNKQTQVIREVSCTIAPIFDEGKNITNFIGAMSDVTEIKKTKQRLRNLNDELEEKVKIRTNELEETQVQLKNALEKEQELGVLKSRFVSMASHEFRTPLSSILSSADLIGRYIQTEQKDKQHKHVSRIKSSVKNLTNILNDFLSLEKLESGMIRCEPDLLNFEKYVDEIMEEINLISKGKQEIRFQHTGDCEVYIDPYLVKNILINLFSNAIKYSPSGEHIELNSKNENGLLQIHVKDRGIGIPKADHKNMFNRFFRATNATNIQGTGLGLTIVKRYLDLMGGEIDFESEENKGTTFKVQIPQ